MARPPPPVVGPKRRNRRARAGDFAARRRPGRDAEPDDFEDARHAVADVEAAPACAASDACDGAVAGLSGAQ